jgi:hypothetical protein
MTRTSRRGGIRSSAAAASNNSVDPLPIEDLPFELLGAA